MKAILDQIINRERELQEKTEQAEREAREILENAKLKSEMMEEEYAQQFEDEINKREREVLDAGEAYHRKLLDDTRIEMEKKIEALNKKKEKLKQEIINRVLQGAAD